MADEKDNNPHNSSGPKRDKVSEVRYIPIEYLSHSEKEEGKLDLIALSKTIWDGRWTIAKITGVFLALGLFFAIFSPVTYESEAILMPEAHQQQDRAGQLLQQFGGAFGFGSGSLGQQLQTGTVPPTIYPRIVNSLSFQLELINQPVRFADYGVTTTIPDFYENHYSPSLTEWIWRLTAGLPYTILNWIRGEEDYTEVLEEDPLRAEFISLTRKDLYIINDLRNRISVNLDERTGLLTSTVNLHDARASAEINRHIIELLREYVTHYRVEKVQQDLEFVEDQHRQARERFETTQLNLAEFRDQNVRISTARAETELERLQDEKNLAFNIYSSLSQRLEESKLRLQEETPVFSTIQAVNIPSERASPNRRLIVLVSLLLGLVAGVLIYFGKFFLTAN